MRIAHIITGLRRGGAEMMLYRLAKAHKAIGIDSIVFSLNSNGELKSLFESSDIKVVDLDFSSSKINFHGIAKLSRKIREYNPDLIQCWMYHANFFGLIASKIAGKYPVFWNIRNSTLDVRTSSRVTILIMKVSGLLSDSPDRIISCSEDAKEIHIAQRYKEEKFIVIPNGIDISMFSPSKEARDDVRKNLGIKPHDFVVGIAGRYDPQKDYATFLQAAKLISALKSNIYYVLCGNDVDEQNIELRHLIKEGNLQDKMHLLGHQSQMQEIYPGMDVLVSSSAYGEAFPNVLAEAMACGVPCVSTDVGDAAYIIADTGYVVPVKDPQAIADAVNSILSLSKDERENLKQAARARIVENFSLDRISKLYKDTYEEVLRAK